MMTPQISGSMNGRTISRHHTASSAISPILIAASTTRPAKPASPSLVMPAVLPDADAACLVDRIGTVRRYATAGKAWRIETLAARAAVTPAHFG